MNPTTTLHQELTRATALLAEAQREASQWPDDTDTPERVSCYAEWVASLKRVAVAMGEGGS